MKICFFCKIANPGLLESIEFYKQDIDILRSIDPQMKIATRYRDIDWNVDVLFIWWWTYALYPIVVSKLKRRKIRTIITGTFNYRCPQAPIDYFRRPWYQRFLIKAATKLVDKNVFVSYNEYTNIQSDWNLNNALYIPHSVDTDKYYIDSNNVRSDYLFTMALLGRESINRKCVMEMIDAISIVRNQIPEVRLLIAGHKGDAYDEVKSYIYKCNLQNNVILLGQISFEEKLKYLKECRAYLQPSRFEGFGLAIAEAMSCGCTVITTSIGEIPNVLGDAGIYVDVEPKSIADAIINLYKFDVNDYGKRARKRVTQIFPMSRRTAELQAIVNNQ